MRFFRIIFLILLIFSIFFVIYLNRDKAVVKNIVVKSDININKKEFIVKMGLKNNKYIWEYNLIEIGKKLSRLYYVDEYKLSFSYPTVLNIELKIRKPLARIVGADGNIYFLDKKGGVYKSGKIKLWLPLLIFDGKENIGVGKRLKGKYADVIDLLYRLSDKYGKIYSSISQIEVDFSNRQPVYNINFRTINKTITLKKYLNVENIVNSVAVLKVTEEIDTSQNNIYGLDDGFFYKLNGEE